MFNRKQFQNKLLELRMADMNNLFDMLTVVYKYKKLYEKCCQETMKRYDLRIADIDILYYVAHSGPRNLSKDIVDMGMSKANVSKSVEHLHGKGLVELTEDKEDRRCVHIELTEEAQEVIREVIDIRRTLGKALSEGISETDKEVIARVLHQINQNMARELFHAEKE